VKTDTETWNLQDCTPARFHLATSGAELAGVVTAALSTGTNEYFGASGLFYVT